MMEWCQTTPFPRLTNLDRRYGTREDFERLSESLSKISQKSLKSLSKVAQ